MFHDDFLADFDLLTKPGLAGLFDHFEFIEIVRYQDGYSQPTNVFTIGVAIENGKPQSAKFLNNERIRLAGLKGYNFGICRSVLTIASLRKALDTYFRTNVWRPGEPIVSVGELKPIAKCFLPPNAATEISLNRALKNNFFNGSYALELFDVDKPSQDMFQKMPEALLDLSARISEIVPIQIGSLSDRLGNIIIQFPIDAIRARFRTDEAKFQVEVAWHPKIDQRELIAMAQVDHDQSLASFGQGVLRSGLVTLAGDPGYGTLNGFVWDPENQIILAATGELAFIKTMSLDIAARSHEPRTIPSSVEDTIASERIMLSSQPRSSIVGNDPSVSISEPIRKRIYADELAALARRRKFLQYAAYPRSGISDRERALTDVRSLIASHGAYGAWLWDPFLAPQDILDTLFHNPTFGAQMRALTALKKQKEDKPEQPSQLRSSGLNKSLRILKTSVNQGSGRRTSVGKIELVSSYRKELTSLPGNFLGLNIEYRSAHGPRGWDFHDRFLIFPKSRDEPAKAWSLGTSVNSLGKSHHILQQADNAQLIADAFQSLWDAVDHPHNLLWKWP